ncbi:MAG: DNA repair protein RadC [Bacteroidaceae bacterium]|nr:DNA repair protein RadC [Bacteroidaceae bacterium]
MVQEKHKTTIKEWPIDERPREKAARHGIASLSKSELLAMLIGSGTAEDSAVELMRKVLASCGDSIARLSRLSADDLCQFKGIGPAKAMTIMAACELWKRRENDNPDEVRCIRSSRDLFNYFYPLMCDNNVEECYVLLLNNMHRVIAHTRIGSGGFTATLVDIRLVMREALLKRATSVALCHNHPSGSLKPSKEDDKITESLAQACKIMNIRFLDHIILTADGYYSYVDENRF